MTSLIVTLNALEGKAALNLLLMRSTSASITVDRWRVLKVSAYMLLLLRGLEGQTIRFSAHKGFALDEYRNAKAGEADLIPTAWPYLLRLNQQTLNNPRIMI